MTADRAGRKSSDREDPESFPIPKPTYLRRHVIQGFAEQVAKKFELMIGQDLEDLVERLGGKLVRMSFPDVAEVERRIGSIAIWSPNRFKIFLLEPQDMGPVSTRETIAHELGHLFLHYPLAGGRMRANHTVPEKETRLAELEAIWFAEAFLVPREALSQLHRKEGNNYTDLAARFSVSELTIRNRIAAIGA